MPKSTNILYIENYLKRLSQRKPNEEGGQRLSDSKLVLNSYSQTLLVSVITVVYNAEATLEATIKSVLAQTYQNIEYIIIDGGSTDQTLSIIKKYKKCLDYWRSEPDGGLYDALNKGISLCRGKLIGIIHAGDTYTPQAVSQIVNAYLNAESASILIGNCKQMINQAHSKWWIRSGSLGPLPTRTLPHPPVFVPLEIYQSVGLFETTPLKIASDYDFFCRCFTHSVNFVHVNQIVAIAGFAGLSSNYYVTAIEELRVRLRYIPKLLAIMIFLRSCITITGHKALEYLGLWSLIEKRRYGSVR